MKAETKLSIVVWLACIAVLSWAIFARAEDRPGYRIPDHDECVRQHRLWFSAANRSPYNHDAWRAVSIWRMARDYRDVTLPDEHRRDMLECIAHMCRREGRLPRHQ